MESESAGDSGPAPGAPLLFVSDASAEAERLTLALRARGYTVADVPLALLPGRVAIQRPAMVLCDADAEGAVDALHKIREVSSRAASPGKPLSVVLVGERDGTIARIDVALVDAVFARPVNVQELVGTVERLVGVGPSVALGSMPPSARGSKLTTSSSRPPGRNSSSPTSGRSVAERPLRAEMPSGVGAPVPLPPDLAADGPAQRDAGDAPVVELAADIQLLLLGAERRLGDDRAAPASGGDEPGPEVDVEAPLPPDVLLALEEPLDEEDDPEKTGAPERAHEGTSALKTGQRGHTISGGTSAGGLGTDTGAPVSEPSFGGSGAGARGPRTSVHPHTDGDGLPEALDPADEGESRRARQQASTPRPPKPAGPEDLKASAPPDLEKRVSVPPATSVENVPADPPSRRAWDEERSSLRSGGMAPRERDGTVVEPRTVMPPREAGRERTGLGIDPDGRGGPDGERREDKGKRADRGDLMSTTPPVRPKDERGTDRPAADDSRPLHESDRPSAPGAGRRGSEPPAADAGKDAAFTVPSVLRLGDAVAALARAIRARFSGALAFEVDEGIRRVVLRDGDFVTAASGVHGESLVAFLAARGDIPPDIARQAHKLPASGRRAGAALIAHGHLAQDQLWPVLRAHAEWIIGRVVGIERGGASKEDLGRLHDEPAVFGGATGAEVLVEVVRRIVSPEEALERLGGTDAVLGQGPSRALLGECALSVVETERVREAQDSTVEALLEGSVDPSLTSALYALVSLGVLSAQGARPRPPAAPAPPPVRDELDEEAGRARILSRKALVDEGDYFSVLGVARDATGYDIRRAYTALRREFEPSRVLTSKNSDLGDVVDEIVEVLEEAYEILSDQRRRDRYRRAIEASP